jgi:hypothetical protein
MALAAITLLFAASNAVAQTPPMGWNSYDCYSYAVTEAQVRENADFMAKRLKRFGWEYVVIDYVWSAPKLRPDFAMNQSKDFQPLLAMDAYGRLTPDPGRFPTAANGKGFGPLASSLHRMGLKFGIHLMRGIPRQAVAEKCPIEGTEYSADQAADTHNLCGWLNHMDGINTANRAGQAYLDSIFRLYARWGVDFVKVDDMSNPYHTREIEGYRTAIDRCGRPIVLSLSPGPTPVDQGGHVERFANMWRLVGDLWDTWPQVQEAIDTTAKWNGFRAPGHWPDIDMLPLGKLRKYGPQTGPPNTDSRLTEDEAQTLMTLFCVTQNPLMFGGNLPETNPATLALLTNGEAMDLDQHGADSETIQNSAGGLCTWRATLHGHFYWAYINRGSTPLEVNLSKGKRWDVWNRKLVADETTTLAPHASILIRVE